MRFKFPVLLFFGISFLLLLPGWTTAQSPENATILRLKDRTIILNKDLQQLKRFTDSALAADGTLLILQFKKQTKHRGKFSPAFQKEVYLGNQSFLCRITQKNSLEEWQQYGIEGWARILPKDKISTVIQYQHNNAPIEVLIQFAPDFKSAQIMTLLRSVNAILAPRQLWQKKHIRKISISAEKIDNLASNPSVLYIQPAFHPKPLNVMAEGYTNTAIAHSPLSLGGYHLLGNGVTIGIGDDSNPHHVDYNDRLKSFNPQPTASHATHTTGTVGGNGIIDQRYRGFAPECNLVEDWFSQIIANAAVYYNSFGMVATNNSYAMIVGDCNYAGTYDVYSALLDQQAFDLPQVLSMFAAGNDGALHCNPYPINYATVVGAYSTAKNVLTVNAIGLLHTIEYYKFSRGPVKDGRLKPEITAMGYRLMSTWTDNTYHLDNGTSMSTPNVTGAAGLLIERYRQLHNNQNPDNALVKLVLMNGAVDIANPGPDFHYGFGLMNVGNSLKMLDSNQYFSGNIQTGEQQNFTFHIPSGISLAKVMLYWNDPPASPMATTDLVNDLDLTVGDLGGINHFPLVLNPSPSHVADFAVPGQDHRNNVEQVVLKQPASGDYTIHIKGFNIPEGPQKYYVAYSFVPRGISFKYPFGDEALMAGDSVYVYWQASKSIFPFSLSLSTDGGNSWQILDNIIGADRRGFLWYIPDNLNSTQCLLKITRDTTTVTSHPFTVTKRAITTFAADSEQCPGNIRFSWHPIPGISSYSVFRKMGMGMKAIDTTADTTFTITGLSPDSIYWIAVAPIIGNKTGIRSVAQSYHPKQGNCSLINQHGDLRMVAIVAPQTGRKHSSSELQAQNPFKIKIRNLDNQPADSFTIYWQLNNTGWQSQSFHQFVESTGFRILTLPDLNLSDTGIYALTVVVTNNTLADPIPSNDTLKATIRQLANPPINLLQPFSDNFETFPAITLIGNHVMGVGNSNRWDFEAQQKDGRLRSYVNNGVTIQGNRSISMDNTINETGHIQQSSQNYFTGTFNLSNYQVDTNELRCGFDYFLSGKPAFNNGNEVWIRGNENDSWLPLFHYQTDSLNPGNILQSGSLSLNDALLQAGQHFSATTQIRFGQRDTAQIESASFGNGFTMDNFRLYQVQNDIQLLSIDSVAHFNCALSDQLPLHTRFYNSVTNTVYQISVSYQLDNQPVVTEIIDSIPGKDTMEYVFQNTLNLSVPGLHHLSVWCAAPMDSYHQNDSILDFVIHNEPVIDSFPYLETFENGNGYFYSEGANDSWQYGTPAAPKINHAASGTKVWKTNLSGSYNNNEHSFLYSPCFDISQLSNPVLSFSLATDIENNPNIQSVYDEAFVAYTTDGKTWHRLGTAEEGYNWYNNPIAEAWTAEGNTWWQVATIPLPHISGAIAFRFALKSDPGATFAGLALDDIHIYDLKYPVYSGDSLPAPTSQNIPAGTSQNFISHNQILAHIKNNGNNLNKVSLQVYRHQHFVNLDSSQYFLPENFVLKSQNTPTDSVQLTLYVPDTLVKQLRLTADCPSCNPVDEIYRMGISVYSDVNKNKENNLLSDDKNGDWQYIPYQKIHYIPYGKGYQVQCSLKTFGEIWFNAGGPDANAPLNEHLFDFHITHNGERGATLKWHSLTDNHTQKYMIQRAADSNFQFLTIDTLTSLRDNHHDYSFVDTPYLTHPYVFYRIRYRNDNGQFYLSPVRRLDWSDKKGQVSVFPNPVHNNQSLYIRWFKGNDKALEWRFYDLSGRLLQSGKFGGNPYNDKEQLYPAKWGLTPGIYLLKIVGLKQDWTFKIVYQP